MRDKGEYLRWIVILIYIISLVAGAVSDAPDELSAMNATQCQSAIIVGFLLFFVVCALGGLLEKITFVVFVCGSYRMANQGAPRDMFPKWSFGWKFFKFGGLFFIFFGSGMAASSVWTDALRFWQGCVMVSSGSGLVFGTWLAKRILGEAKAK